MFRSEIQPYKPCHASLHWQGINVCVLNKLDSLSLHTPYALSAQFRSSISLVLPLCFFLRLFLPSRVIPFGIIILCEEWLHYLFSPYEKCAHLCRSAATVKYIIQSHSRGRGGGERSGERGGGKGDGARGKHCVYAECSGKRLHSTVIYAFNDRNFRATCVAHMCTHTHMHRHAHTRTHPLVCISLRVYKLPFCYLIRKVFLCKSLDAL